MTVDPLKSITRAPAGTCTDAAGPTAAMRPERITIGRFPTQSVEQARVKAKRYLADLGEGISVSGRLRNEALIGKTLGDRYKVVAPLGSGAMGDVYLAEHVVLGKKMAVKVLKQDFCRDEELVKRFEQEAVAVQEVASDPRVRAVYLGESLDA